jgi:PIN domain
MPIDKFNVPQSQGQRYPKIRAGDLVMICLDSNLFVSNPSLSNQDWDTLKKFIADHSNTIVIVPDVVLKEVTPKIIQLGKIRIKDYQKAIGECLNFGIEISHKIDKTQMSSDLESFSKGYKNYISKNLFKKSIFPKTPKVKIDTMLDYAIQGKKPFNSNGTDGFKDYLIWETFLGNVKLHDRGHFVFISANTSDFSNQNSFEMTFHQDLFPNIELLTNKKRQFYYYTNFNFLNDLKPDVTKNIELIEKSLEEEIERNMDAIVHQGLTDQIEKKLPFSNSDEFYISSISLSPESTTSIKRISKNKILVNAKGHSNINVEYFVDKSNVFEAEIEGASVSTYDWNDHVSECEFTFEEDFTYAMELQEDKSGYTLLKLFVEGGEIDIYE